MGGINCNSPGNNLTIHADPALSRVMGEYVHKLASYSADLFAGVASFYDANAKIEAAVLGSGDIGAALDALRQSEGLLVASQFGISPVASLWGMVATSDPVDFSVQDGLLNAAVRAVSDARAELDMVPRDGCDIQAEIWARPAITACLIEANDALTNALGWQSHFASRTVAMVLAA